MSNKKCTLLIASSTLMVAVFTVWNVWDFCRSEVHSTAAYLAVIFNLYAVVETVRIIAEEVKRRRRG